MPGDEQYIEAPDAQLVTMFKDLALSRLMLGTVQFGMSYGIANTSGRPTYETARDIIAAAYEGGVNCLDTAANYGTSEEVLGRALDELGLRDVFTVVTKIPLMGDDFDSQSAVDGFVESSVIRSLKRLKLQVLPVCLFHAEDDFRYIESLLKLRERGLVRYVGCSVMTPTATARIVASGLADAVQLPTSVLDMRYLRQGIYREAARRGVGLFVRSIYLQGLLLMPEADIIPELRGVIPVRRRLAEIAGRAGVSVAELAARYIQSLEGVTCAVVGVETVEQMRHNTELFSKGPLDASVVRAIEDAVPELPDEILMPNKWSKRIPDAVPASRRPKAS